MNINIRPAMSMLEWKSVMQTHAKHFIFDLSDEIKGSGFIFWDMAVSSESFSVYQLPDGRPVQNDRHTRDYPNDPQDSNDCATEAEVGIYCH